MSETAAAHELSCPACDSAKITTLGRTHSVASLVRCDSCRHNFLDTRRISHEALAAIYSEHFMGYVPDIKVQTAFAQFVRDELASRIPPPARILDLGCGNGDFLACASAAGYDVHGFDASSAAVEMCRRRGLRAECGDFLQWTPLVSDSEGARLFDAITLWDVLEHFVDPIAYLRHARELLRPGGSLFIKTPMINKLSIVCVATVPRLAGALLSAPAHIQFFVPESLNALLNRGGFSNINWLPSRGIHSVPKGGAVRKKIARRVTQAIKQASGDRNALLFASLT